MNRRPLFALVLLAALAWPALSNACLWDSDTLRQERARFPSTLELITGKFLRHSPEFYEWRIKDRTEKLKSDPSNLQFHDDLAVAYSKTGQHEKAIATMHAKEKIQPGLYETYSNLGTFHILAGEFEKGLPWIDKALAINPDAHFGRERYQKWLVEWALANPVSIEGKREKTFYGHILGNTIHGNLELYQKAVKGILGMMRFANYDHPLLLEALGDVLLSSGYDRDLDAKRLAARAYLQASYVTKDAESKRFREKVRKALELQTRSPGSETPIPTAELEADFTRELADANAWYAELKAKELGWIRDGKNPEAEFDALYTEEPQIPDSTSSLWRKSLPYASVGVGVLLLAVVLMLFLCRGRCCRRAKSGSGPAVL